MRENGVGLTRFLRFVCVQLLALRTNCGESLATSAQGKFVKQITERSSKNWLGGLHVPASIYLCAVQVEKVVNEFAMHLVHGSSYHPQSQGSVEKANELFKVTE